jgi:hypothetical protein
MDTRRKGRLDTIYLNRVRRERWAQRGPALLAYDRKMRLIGMDTWRDLFEDSDARLIAQSTVGPWSVSTIWLGIDRRYGMNSGPPLVFETLVFDGNSVAMIDRWRLEFRWSYEREARIGHRDVASFARAVLIKRGDIPEDTTANKEENTWPGQRRKQRS